MKTFVWIVGFTALFVGQAISATAQYDVPPDRDWGSVLNAEETAVHDYLVRVGLNEMWGQYCRFKVQSEDASHPKDGSIPLGITDWDALDTNTFRIASTALGNYDAAARIACLANVKRLLNEASAK